MPEKYIIERPDDCETWFLWDANMGATLKCGSIETVTEYLRDALKGVEDGQ